MRLRNKETGEIKYVGEVLTMRQDDGISYKYCSLAELNKEWEDYEEPKPQVVYYIDRDGRIVPYKNIEYPKRIFDAEQNKEIGNYFETKEEAELAVCKLKAWKRLKDKGFRFQGWEDLEAIELPIKHFNNIIGFRLEDNHDVIVDLNIIFGGEE